MSLTQNDAFEPFERREHEIEVAARTIVALSRKDQFGRGWRPKGVDEVAILLESLGYSPEVVSELWYPDLFALARDVNVSVERYVTDEERNEPPDISWFTRTCRDYAVGSLYSAPWIVAVIGLAIFGASLWSSLSTPLHLATAIALGVYSAQILSGFFAQAVARRLTFYFLQDNDALMAWTVGRFVLIGLLVTLTASLLLWLILRPFYGDPDAWLAASFCAGSTLFQLSLAPLYTLRRFGWIVVLAVTAGLITGLTFVLSFHRIINIPWEPATLAGEVGVLGLLGLGATLLWLSRRARRATTACVPPRFSSIVASTLPYAVFGALYFLAILTDRFCAGIAAGKVHGFIYASSYELGSDIALLAILPVIGVINIMLEALPRRILRGAKSSIVDRTHFDGAMLRFYLLGIVGVIVASALATGIGELVGPRLIFSPTLGSLAHADVTLAVLRIAIPAYGLFMFGLLNTQMLFFLSRPAAPILSIALATLATIAWSTWALLHGSPPATMVYGLAAAGFVFAAITTVATIRTMRHFSYAYYAAY
ncbi:MAG: hypothetical protein ACYDA5_06780 [Vulcanimicrobiaceae bacterium]